jgi:hypothetical protein
MANTFKTVTKAGVTTVDTIYTVAASTTTVVLGVMVGNTIVMETTDVLKLTASGAADIAVSIMEIT